MMNWMYCFGNKTRSFFVFLIEIWLRAFLFLSFLTKNILCAELHVTKRKRNGGVAIFSREQNVFKIFKCTAPKQI